MSRQELEFMFGVEDLRKTRFAQELIAETEQKAEIKVKLNLIPQLLKEGFSPEKIAAILQLEPQQVQEFINSMN